MSDFVRSEHSLLANGADLLIVSSRGLQRKHENKNPLLAPNAVDFRFFTTGDPGTALQSIPRPVIGYFGAVAEWFDFDLVKALAASRPNYSFVVVGRWAGDGSNGTPNIYMLGQKPYEALPSLLAEFDVCMIPFIRNSVTDVTDPVKLYEYFSRGKPVVATDLEELREHGQIYLAADAESFASGIDQALSECPERKAARISFASQNTWKDRAEQIDDAIRSLLVHG